MEFSCYEVINHSICLRNQNTVNGRRYCFIPEDAPYPSRKAKYHIDLVRTKSWLKISKEISKVLNFLFQNFK